MAACTSAWKPTNSMARVAEPPVAPLATLLAVAAVSCAMAGLWPFGTTTAESPACEFQLPWGCVPANANTASCTFSLLGNPMCSGVGV